MGGEHNDACHAAEETSSCGDLKSAMLDRLTDYVDRCASDAARGFVVEAAKEHGRREDSATRRENNDAHAG